ncbi:hypothetical protein [Streptomyces sp. R527F]|uniref:hypothetical protein n=1 Tax=Streptomyces sp. R527F TaxID=1664033 RepID=UPI001F1C74EC|nr:hypothetical protein [Streptomyces sp. R527F]UIZ12796.1 hypothetical protein LZ559_10335 [Streptomyces sp. R527F]
MNWPPYRRWSRSTRIAVCRPDAARAGTPVLSIHQTDIIHYGTDLADYITQEFNGPPHGEGASCLRSTVAFWRDLVD